MQVVDTLPIDALEYLEVYVFVVTVQDPQPESAIGMNMADFEVNEHGGMRRKAKYFVDQTHFLFALVNPSECLPSVVLGHVSLEIHPLELFLPDFVQHD